MAYTRTLSWARPPKSTAAHRPMVGMRQFSEIHRRGDASGAAGAAGQQAPAPGTFGSALPAHDAGRDERLFTTTSGDFYASKVELARTQGRPPPEQADDARFIGGYPALKERKLIFGILSEGGGSLMRGMGRERLVTAGGGTVHLSLSVLTQELPPAEA